MPGLSPISLCLPRKTEVGVSMGTGERQWSGPSGVVAKGPGWESQACGHRTRNTGVRQSSSWAGSCSTNGEGPQDSRGPALARRQAHGQKPGYPCTGQISPSVLQSQAGSGLGAWQCSWGILSGTHPLGASAPQGIRRSDERQAQVTGLPPLALQAAAWRAIGGHLSSVDASLQLPL